MAGRREHGESLLELLVAVAIITVTVVALVGGLGAAILMSDVHRKQATAGATMRSYAEAIQATIASGGYVDCATTATYRSPAGFTAPAGFTTGVVAGSMRYWSGTVWLTGCGADTGLQRLTVQVESNDGRARQELVVVLRRPCGLADPLCA